MQKKKLAENRKQLVLFHLFSLLIRFSCLVMYYAAGLTLNTLFAGISSPIVSVPALAVAAGAVLGRFLFQSFRQRMLEELSEEECRLSALKQELAVSDLVSVILAVVLCGWGGVILGAGVLSSWTIRLIRIHKEEYELTGLLLSVSLGTLAAVSAMKTGRAGLYGVIMYCLIAMDILRMHRQLRFEEKGGEESDLKVLFLLSIAKIMTSAVFLVCAFETNRVLSYRLALSRPVSAILGILCALCAAAAYVLADRQSVSLKTERLSSLITVVLTLLYCLKVNWYLALLSASGSMALLLMAPLLGGSEDTEAQENVWHGVMSLLFLAAVTAGSYLLYWAGKAPFDQILYNVILFMTVSMHTGIHEYSEVLIDGELEFTEDTPDHLADSDQSDQSVDVRD